MKGRIVCARCTDDFFEKVEIVQKRHGLQHRDGVVIMALDRLFVEEGLLDAA